MNETMKTYITILFNSEGGRPSDVVDELMQLGFKPIAGPYDMVYEWPRQASVREAIEFADQIQLTLEGLGVFFKIETVE